MSEMPGDPRVQLTNSEVKELGLKGIVVKRVPRDKIPNVSVEELTLELHYPCPKNRL